MPDRPWSVPREWDGWTAFILGGGLSLAAVDVGGLREKGRVIAINDAFLRAPWADVHYWADARWFDWNRNDLHRFAGRYRVTGMKAPSAPGVHHVRRDKAADLSLSPDAVAGQCGGANAINLAFHFGAARIVLFGFDMRPGNWHERHRAPTRPGRYADTFIPALERMGEALRRFDVAVINATPGSALRCFPIVTPEEALAA